MPLADFIQFNLTNKTPILYMNGDAHMWEYKPRYYGQSSFLHVVLSGEGMEPPTILTIHNNGKNAVNLILLPKNLSNWMDRIN